MRTVKWNWGVWTLSATALGVCVLAGVASAITPMDATTEQSGSIIVFPKVVWNGTQDTLIQITNTGNPVAQARCFYIDGGPLNPNSPPGPSNPVLWSVTDFNLFLTKQQPTQWVASQGRKGAPGGFKTATAGISPGLVPPVRKGFTGELKCVQVLEDDVPVRANQLKGEAVLRRTDGDVSKYNAVALRGNPGAGPNENPNVLDLNWTQNNPGGQYSACPDTLLFNHVAGGAPDLTVEQIGACDQLCFGGLNEGLSCTSDTDCVPAQGGHCLKCPVTTTLTLVPCSQDIENLFPGESTVQFKIFSEFEQPFSASVTVDCWLSANLREIHPNAFSFPVLGSFGAYTRITPNPGDPGVLGIVEESRLQTRASNGFGKTGTTAANLHGESNRFDASGVTDQMVLSAP